MVKPVTEPPLPPPLPPLYRGLIEPLPEGGVVMAIREDRRPRDTGDKPAFNAFFNLMIERRFGVPQVRRRALFVSGSLRSALRYAAEPTSRHLALVEPVGPFRSVFAPAVADSAALADDLGQRWLSCFRDWQRDECKPLLDNGALTLADLEAFFGQHPHVDRGGFAWGGSSLRQRLLDALDRAVGDSPQATFRYVLDEALDGAAAAGAEILIFDCPQGCRLTPVPQSAIDEARAGPPTSLSKS